MFSSIYQVMENFFLKKATNIFPVKHTPRSIIKVLEKGNIHGPVPVPQGFRGKPLFDYEKCIGCGMCEKVCPARAIEMYPVVANERKSKRVVIYLARCTYCSECAEVCPKEAIVMSQDFMTADYDKYADSLVVGIGERRLHEVHEEPAPAQEVQKEGD